MSPRLALQLMGTEAGRDVFHPDFWVIQLKNKLDSDGKYIISDLRFPNEIKAIMELNGLIIRVKRGPEPEWYDTAYEENRGNFDPLVEVVNPKTMEVDYPQVHISEWAWVGYDDYFQEVIENDGDLNDLEEKVNKFMEFMK